MQLSLELPEEIVSKLQTVENRNEFVSQAILAAFVQHGSKMLSKPMNSEKSLGHVSNILALLDSPEFKAIPSGNPAEIEKTIQANRNDWDS